MKAKRDYTPRNVIEIKCRSCREVIARVWDDVPELDVVFYCGKCNSSHAYRRSQHESLKAIASIVDISGGQT